MRWTLLLALLFALPGPTTAWAQARTRHHRPAVGPTSWAAIKHSGGTPTRLAREVKDVRRLAAGQWLVKPAEEFKGDFRVTTAPETDLRAATVANDPRRLRIDLLLYHPVGRRSRAFFAVKIAYRGRTTWVAYLPRTSQLVRFTVRQGRARARKVLRQTRGGDEVRVLPSHVLGRLVARTRVSLFLVKDHLLPPGGRGRRMGVAATGVTGLLSPRTGRLTLSDELYTVGLHFRR